MIHLLYMIYSFRRAHELSPLFTLTCILWTANKTKISTNKNEKFFLNVMLLNLNQLAVRSDESQAFPIMPWVCSSKNCGCLKLVMPSSAWCQGEPGRSQKHIYPACIVHVVSHLCSSWTSFCVKVCGSVCVCVCVYTVTCVNKCICSGVQRWEKRSNSSWRAQIIANYNPSPWQQDEWISHEGAIQPGKPDPKFTLLINSLYENGLGTLPFTTASTCPETWRAKL